MTISRFIYIFSSHLQHLFTPLDPDDPYRDCMWQWDFPAYGLYTAYNINGVTISTRAQQ